MTETMGTKVIEERQAKIRAFLLEDRLHNPVWEMLAQITSYGPWADRRWWLIGKMAVYNQGASLSDDDIWEDIENEMKIPTTLWVDGLRGSQRARSDTQQVLRARAYKFPVTTWGNNVRVRAPSWWNNKMREVKPEDVLAFLGLIGGQSPTLRGHTE